MDTGTCEILANSLLEGAKTFLNTAAMLAIPIGLALFGTYLLLERSKLAQLSNQAFVVRAVIYFLLFISLALFVAAVVLLPAGGPLIFLTWPAVSSLGLIPLSIYLWFALRKRLYPESNAARAISRGLVLLLFIFGISSYFFIPHVKSIVNSGARSYSTRTTISLIGLTKEQCFKRNGERFMTWDRESRTETTYFPDGTVEVHVRDIY